MAEQRSKRNDESLGATAPPAAAPPAAASPPPAADWLIMAREALLDRLPGVASTPPINRDLPAAPGPAPADLAARLRSILQVVRAEAMDEHGSRVEYDAIRRSPRYAAYRQTSLSALRQFEPARLPGEAARRAFWLNLYNALVFDAVITFGVRDSVTEGPLGLLAFFRRAAYIVGGRRVTLEDMEHGILRGNRGHPYVPGSHFASSDHRRAWVLPVDPRIHFALNCGGLSCPPIRAYEAASLDAQLDLATQAFLATTVTISPDRHSVRVSRIFRWYQGDFGGRRGVLTFLASYLPDDAQRRWLRQAGDSVRLHYAPYDWRLNAL